MTDLTQYLTELHRATKVGFFVADHQGHLTERFKAPAMPDLPSIYLTRLIKHSLASGVYLYLSNPKECFTVIVSSAPQATLIIAWMSSTTLEETEFYQEHFPTLSSQRLVALSKTIYFTLCQINEFKSELLWTDHSIPQISTQLGFSSPSTATRVFKRETGLTPRQYRQRYHI